MDPEQPEEEEELTLYNETRTRRDGTGETRRTISWIWLNARKAQDDDEKDEILRAEWAKSRARAARAEEEVSLLKEEMNRVLKYLAWKARWWRERATLRRGLSSDMEEGVRSYALSQGAVQDALATHFCRVWDAPLQGLDDSRKKQANGGKDGKDDNSDLDEDLDEEQEGRQSGEMDEQDVDERVLP